MNMLMRFVWLLPFVIIFASFFTSRIVSYRFTRYLIYFFILFLAFISDLQSISFRYDKIDILFYRAVLFVFADFFWRIVRNRKMYLRIGGIIIGIALFLWNYYEWIIVGPAYLNRLWNSQCVSVCKAKGREYYLKIRRQVYWKDSLAHNILLFKTLNPPILEQRIDKFHVPKGYERSNFSFVWDTTTSNMISVQIVGDNDTLWTLGEPLPR